jgi:hypothetical protein
MRFDELIRGGMLVRDVKVAHPATRSVFEDLGFRDSCDDCSIDTVCRKYGLDARDVVQKLNEVAAAVK